MPKNILMPALSPTMKQGNLVKWLKKEGDTVKDGEIIAEIETDKANMEVEANNDGILAKILIQEGTESVAVNTPIAILTDHGEAYNPSALDKPKATTVTQEPQIVVSTSQEHSCKAETGTKVFITPLAKRIASQNNINTHSISGSGPSGRIIKADIETAMSNQPQKTNSTDFLHHHSITRDSSGFPDYELVKVSSMRKTIATRLVESKQTAPHFYLSIECKIDNLLAARKQMNGASNDIKLTVNDFIIKAVAMSLVRVPKANAAWFDDGIHMFKTADVSVAVAIDDGLITPVVRSAESMGLTEISKNVKFLAQKAKDGKLSQEEFQGGTFTVSNMGMFGINNFCAIINPPQGCILAVGAGVQRPIVVEGDIEIATMMNCTLSVDHRVVDGAVGALFLQELKKNIENPTRMLL